MAELRDWDQDHPSLVICKRAGFGHGGIYKKYKKPKVSSVECFGLGPRVSWKMETLGSILLHEYTHWTKFIVPPMGAETKDYAYGPKGARDLDKVKAVYNADSYSWLANEYFWSTNCSKKFGDPQDTDGMDPNYDQYCKKPKPPMRRATLDLQ